MEWLKKKFSKQASEPDFFEWLQQGYRAGWCGPAVCYMHDGLPTSDEENEVLDEGLDPCLHLIRLYESPEHKAAVEESHSPSQWRASNVGL